MLGEALSPTRSSLHEAHTDAGIVIDNGDIHYVFNAQENTGSVTIAKPDSIELPFLKPPQYFDGYIPIVKATFETTHTKQDAPELTPFYDVHTQMDAMHAAMERLAVGVLDAPVELRGFKKARLLPLEPGQEVTLYARPIGASGDHMWGTIVAQSEGQIAVVMEDAMMRRRREEYPSVSPADTIATIAQTNAHPVMANHRLARIESVGTTEFATVPYRRGETLTSVLHDPKSQDEGGVVRNASAYGEKQKIAASADVWVTPLR